MGVNRIGTIRSTDRGRPVTDLSSKLDLQGFAADIRSVFANGAPLEKRIDDDEQSAHYLVRLAPYRDGDNRIDGVVVTFIDVTTLTRSEARQRLLIGELQHRTRNLLSVVQSVAQQTLGKGGSLEGFVDRLSALGRVQSLIGGTDQKFIDLGEIVRLELAAIGAPHSKVTTTGPAVAVGLDLVQTLGLALHELATNALKHGALKQEAGRLEISWLVRCDGPDARTLVLDWRESGVSNLQKAPRKGFGAELIEKAVPFTLRAKAALTFCDDGAWCHIELPLSQPPPAPENRP